MSYLDAAVLLGATMLATMWWSARAGRRWLRGGAVLVAAACALQLLVEDAYWQFAPLYALLLAMSALVFRARSDRAASRLSRTVVAILSLVALSPWMMFLPVPQLPAPRGPYGVGTDVFRWIDEGRAEAATDDPRDRRHIVVQVWYPAEAGARGPSPPYIDGLGHLPTFVSLIPSVAMRRYDRIDTHAVGGAPLAAAKQRWPVVLFSPGYGAPRAFYTGVTADLASRGFVVLAVDHPYESAVTELADGRVVTPRERFLPDDPDHTRYMSVQLEVRTADLLSVLERISQPDGLGERLRDRLDLERIAAAGHSFGGASAVAMMAQDQRIAAAANIDGTLYAPLPDQQLRRPFLLLESDHEDSGHSRRFFDGNQRLMDNLLGAGYRFEIDAANHYSFTDAPLFFSPPARFALAMWLGGRRGPQDTQRATGDILVAFLTASLGLSPADVEAAASRHGEIRGGRLFRPPSQ